MLVPWGTGNIFLLGGASWAHPNLQLLPSCTPAPTQRCSSSSSWARGSGQLPGMGSKFCLIRTGGSDPAPNLNVVPCKFQHLARPARCQELALGLGMGSRHRPCSSGAWILGPLPQAVSVPPRLGAKTDREWQWGRGLGCKCHCHRVPALLA